MSTNRRASRDLPGSALSIQEVISSYRQITLQILRLHEVAWLRVDISS